MTDASEQLDRLQTALFASGDVVYDWDLIDDAITWVGRTDALFGGSLSVATGDAFSERVYTEDVASRAKAMAAHFATRDIFDCDYRVRGLGGDCFGIVLSRCPPENLALAAEKILSAVREQPFDTPSGPIHVTASAGGMP